MIFITSGQYLKIEIQNEIGALPPCFSFLQNKRLYEFQVELLRNSWPLEKIILTLPKDFEIPQYDKNRLEELEIEIYRGKDNLDLGKGIYDLIKKFNPNSMKILHGDTYFEYLNTKEDLIIISKPEEIAEWHSLSDNTNYESNLVWAGFFNFSKPKILLKSLKSSKFIFHKSVKKYSEAINVSEKKIIPWYDFGHIEGFHKSREKYTTERSFNDLKVDNYEVTKSSRDKEKISREFFWYLNLPSHLKKFVPNVYGLENLKSKSSYKMTYINGFSLSELMLFSKLNDAKWDNIFYEIKSFLKLQKHRLPHNKKNLADRNFKSFFSKKNKKRITALKKMSFIDFNKKLSFNGRKVGYIEDIVKDLDSFIEKYKPIPAFLHGDLCLSNIIYRARGNTISVIDPRGTFKGKDSLIGDQRYDLAKLAHSIFWNYDRVISDEIKYYRNNNSFEENNLIKNHSQEYLKKIFISDKETSIMMRADVQAITSMLFLTMIPLHQDSKERQNSFFGIGLKIYQNLVKN